VTGTDAQVFERTVRHTLDQSHRLLERVLESTRLALQTLEDRSRTPGERHGLLEARQQLSRLCFTMAERYPGALRQAMAQDTLDRHKHTRSLFTVHFDELELMDEHQIHESVERARAREVLAEAVDAPLAEFNGLACAAQGLPSVNPESNPLRPDMFLQALQTVVGQMQVTDAVRRDWMGPMAQALGAELRSLYAELTAQLQQAGIKPIGFAIRQADGRYAYAPAGSLQGHSPGFANDPAHAAVATAPAMPQGAPVLPPKGGQASPQGQQDALLTLERLRHLLLGDLGGAPAPNRVADFAAHFARTFDGPHNEAETLPPPDFEPTVPAAFEALQEMNQVDRLMERLGSPRAPIQPPPGAGSGLGQALSQEVVALMVDNIAQDPRLLPPVQQVVRALEPALMQLAVADPRFFSDREHPARRLLQEITDRSLGFDNVQAPGFESFLLALHDNALPLAQATIHSRDDFEPVLERLQQRWAESEAQREQERKRAIESLWRAEQRHLLASRLAKQIRHLPEFDLVPAEIGAFLQGPWSQVLAQARLSNDNGQADPGRYREFVDALLWSAQPEETRKNPARLARLVPKLLARLREGLASIGYPPTELGAFMDCLMRLHQMAFQGTAAPSTGKTTPSPAPASAAAPQGRTPRLEAPAEDEPWLAPAEAKESGFMESFGASGQELEAPDTAPTPSNVPDMAVGTWVDLRVDDQWERTQLTWVGPHGTLFLFTSASGRSQSMTRRLRDRLMAQGALRVVSEHTVVGEALDAVARTAMRNSVDTRY
jgi:hypothetical protein